jgi:hypothetical protein
MQLIYLILAILGFIFPYSQFIPFVIDHGLDLRLFWLQSFINQASSAYTLDLFVSSVVFWFFLFQEGTRLKMQYLWIYVVLNLTIGLSFALPLFLWKRFDYVKNLNLQSS